MLVDFTIYWKPNIRYSNERKPITVKPRYKGRKNKIKADRKTDSYQSQVIRFYFILPVNNKKNSNETDETRSFCTFRV